MDSLIQEAKKQGIRILWNGHSGSLNANMTLAIIDADGTLMTFCCTLFSISKEQELCSFVFDLTSQQVLEHLEYGTLVHEVESLALEALTAVSERELIRAKETGDVAIH